MKELEIKEKELEINRKGRRKAYKVALILVIIGALLCLTGVGALIGILLIIGGAVTAEIIFVGNLDNKDK